MEIADREIKLLLEIVSGNGNKGIPLSGIDFTRLIRLSYRHKVVYQMLLFAQNHPEFFSEKQIKKLNERNRKVAKQSLTQLHELKRIAAILNDQNISYVCIKGPQLSRMIYGREALKDSVDLDIMLVNSHDLQAVHNSLSQLGYDETNLNDYPGILRRRIFLIAKREVHYFNKHNLCSVDLHIRPGANTYLTENRFKGLLKHLKAYDLEGTPITVLHDEAYFVYLCYHGALHLFSRLAWLLDIRAFLKQKGEVMDNAKIYDTARILNVERSVALALLLLKEYFGDTYISGFRYAIHTKRMHQLEQRCYRMLGSKPDYALSMKGRFDKVVYIMMLLRGFPAKIDWFYGIFMRQLINLIRK